MNRFYKTTFAYCFTLLCLLAGFKGHAEGSKDLYPTGAVGDRAWLMCTSMPGANTWPFTALGTHFVYAKPGERVLAASSGQNVGAGRIRLTAPDGTVYTSTNDDVGKIPNRAGELAGPLPNAGGYTPFSTTVGATQGGLWKVEFIPTGNITANADNGGTIGATANWTQPDNVNAIAAWDISVRNVGNTAFITGRVYANVMNMYVTDGRYYGRIFVQTNDGYLYRVRNNGIAGIGFITFVNNKGITNGTTDAALPSYKSQLGTGSTTIKDPRAPDGATSITQKIFYSVPNTDLPDSSKLPGGATTWLKVTKIVPTISTVSIDGVEGTTGQVSSKGAYIRFTASQAGTYRITLIKTSPGGTFQTRTMTGTATAGLNSVYWDGKDGNSNRPSTGTIGIDANIQLQGGEVHFPLIDVETNASGMIIEQLNDAGNTPIDNTVYWDDTPLGTGGNPSNPVFNGNTGSGLPSNTNGHIWGGNYGNDRIMDTWTYILGPLKTQPATLVIRQADLQVQNIHPSLTSVPAGQPVTYDVVVVNNGPSDVTNAPFKFDVPSGFNINPADVTFTTSCGNVHGVTVDAAGDYNALLDLPNGCIVTFHIKGTPDASLAGGPNMNMEASIMRPNDVTDPDATNPDPATPPTDPHVECANGGPLPGTCNNIRKDNAVSVTPVADIVTVKTVQTPGKTKYTPGEIVTYIITVTNNGPNDASDVNIVDNAPTGCNITEWTVTSTGVPMTGPTPVTGVGNINQSVSSFPNGGQLTYVVKMKTPANATTDLVNTAVVTTTTSDPVPACPACANTLTPDPQADIVVVKSAAVTEFTPGGADVVYTITVTNNGPSDAKNVRIQDNLPTGGASMTWSASATGMSLPGGTNNGELDQTLLTMPNGAVVTYTVTVKTNPAFTGAKMTNTVSKTSTTPDPTPGNDCNPCQVDVSNSPKADIVVVKSAAVTEFTPGGADVVYTITVTNNGPSNAQDVRIQDALPTGGTSMIWTAASATIIPPANNGTGDLDQTIPVLPNGAVVTYTVTVETDAAFTGTQMTNTVSKTSTTPDPNPACTTCEVDLNNVAKADIVVVKSAAVTEFTPGGADVVYTITVTNNGPSDAKNVNIKDALPAGGASMSWTATATGFTLPAGTESGTGDLDQTITVLPDNAVVTYTVTVATDAAFTGTQMKNVVTETSGSIDPNTANDCNPCEVDLDNKPQADIVVVKSAAQSDFAPGADVIYTIKVTNNGPSDAKNVRIQDALPTGGTSMTWTATSTGFTLPVGSESGTGDLDQTITTLPDQAVVTYTVTVKTNPAFIGTKIKNVVAKNSTTPDPTPGNDCNPCEVDLNNNALADIVVVKSAAVTEFTPGGADVVYTITVKNNGPSDAQNVNIKDLLPAGGSSMSWTATATGFTLPVGGGTGTGNLDQTYPVLPNGALITYTVTVVTDAAFTGTQMKNVVTKTSGTPDPTPGNDCNPCEVDLDNKPQADIEVVKSAAVTEYTPGGADVVYTIKVTNHGPSDAQNVNIKDALPAGGSSMSWTATATGYTLAAGMESGIGNLDQTHAVFPDGAVVTYIVTVKTDAAFTGTQMTNVVTKTSGTPDPTPGNDCSPCEVDLANKAKADIEVVKSAAVTEFTPGGADVVYTIKVTNHGPSDAQNVNIKDALPAGGSSMSWTATATGYTLPAGMESGSGNLDQTHVTLPNGAVVTYIVTVKTDAAFTGTQIKNVVAKTSGTPDPTPGNDCNPCEVDLDNKPQADIEVVKSAVVTEFTPGGADVVYTIKVTNHGPSDAQNVNIKDALPTGGSSMSWTATATGLTLSAADQSGNGNLDKTIATLPNGAVVTYIVTVKTDAAFTGTQIKNVVTKTSGTPDPTPGNDCNPCEVDLDNKPQADIEVVKSAAVTEFTPGDADVVYTIKVTNHGPSDAQNVNIKDALPAGGSSMSWTATATGYTLPAGMESGSGNLDQTHAVLPDGAVVTYIVTVKTDAAYTGAQMKNVVTKTSGTPDPTPGNDCNPCEVDLNNSAKADIEVVKSAAVTEFTPGGADVVYTIKVTNNGPSAASNVRIQDALPTGGASMSWTATATGYTLPAGMESGSGNLDQTHVTLPDGAVVTYIVTVKTDAAFTGTQMKNVVTKTSGTPDPTPGNDCNPCEVDLDNKAKADIEVVKSAAVTEYTPGGADVVYTIKVTNHGPSDAQNVNIKDALPAGGGSMSWTATATGYTLPAGMESGSGNLDQTHVTLPNGAVVTYIVTVKTDAAFTGTQMTNVVTKTSGTPDPTPGNDCNPCEVDLDNKPKADIEVVKSATVTEFTPGGADVVYTIKVTNNGPSDAQNVNIKDALPAGGSSMTWTATATGYTLPAGMESGSGNLDQTHVTLPNGAVVTYTVTVKTDAAFTGTQIKNVVTKTSGTPDPTPGNDCNPCEVDLDNKPQADIEVVKSAAVTEFIPGGADVVYTIRVTNHGPSDAQNVNIKDALPTGGSSMSWTATATGLTLSAADQSGNGNLDKTIATLPNGAVVTYIVAVKTDAAYTGAQMKNVVTKTSGTPDPTPGNDCNPCEVDLNNSAKADIVVVKSAAVTEFTPGGADVVYTIKVTNNGPSAASNVRIQDALPAGGASMSWTATATGLTLSAADQSGNGDLDKTITTLPNGAVVTYIVTVKTDAAFTGTQMKNVVTKTSGTTDPNPGNDCNPCEVDLDNKAKADIVVVKSAAVTEFTPGGADVVYTIKVTNNGPSDAQNVNIKDALPAGGSSMSWTATATGLTLSAADQSGNGDLDKTIATLPNGAVVTYIVTVKTDAAFTGTQMKNVVTKTSGTPDPTPGNDCNPCEVDLDNKAKADIEVVKSAAVTAFTPGGADVVYTIKVTNHGPSDAQNINIKDALPAGGASMSWTATATGLTLAAADQAGNGNLDKTIATLPDGAVVTYIVTVKTDATFTGTQMTNVVTKTSGTPDPTPGNDCNPCKVDLDNKPVADVEIVKSVGVTEFTPGGADVVYTIKVTNHGPSDAKNVRVQDILPSGGVSMTWSTTSGNGSGNLDQTIPVLANGAVVTYTVRVKTDPAYTGAHLVNTATESSDTEDPNGSDPCTTCSATTDNKPVADVEVIKALKDPAQKSFNPGDPVVYTITVTNHGPSDAQNVRVQDALPAGGKSMSWDADGHGNVALPGEHGLSALNQVIPTIPNGGVVTYTVTVTTDPAYTGAQMVNIATESSDTEDPNGTDPCTTCEVPLDAKPSADVQVVKTLKNTTQLNYAPGTPVEYTITVTNHGPSDALNVHIQDALPAGGTSMNWSGVITRGTVPGFVTSGTGNLDQTIASLPNNAILTYTVTVATDPAYTGTLKNVVIESSTTEDPNSGNPCTTCDASVTPKPSADIVTVKKLKNAAQTTFNPGDDIEYVITVTNNGPSDAKNVRVQDMLPAGAKSMKWSATQTGGATVPANNGTTPLDQTIATFPNGAVVTYNITMTTDPAYTGSQIINVAKEESTTDDPNSDDPCTTCQTPLQSIVSADVVTVKKLKNAAQTTFKPGEAVEYVITVTNNGPSDAKNVRVQDALPAGASSMSWNATSNLAITLPANAGNAGIDQTIANLPNGTVVTYNVTVQTPSSFTGNLVNVVTESSATPDPNGTTPCAACTVNTPAAPSADIVTVKTTKTAGKTVFSPGEAVVYTITVTNNGPSDAANVIVKDNAPAGTSISTWKASVTPATVNLPHQSGAGNLNETIASLPDGAVVTYEVTVQTPPTFSGTLSNTAVVSSTTPDPVSGCTACTTTPLNNVPGADIVAVKTLKDPAQTSFKPGDAVVYLITVTNNGPSDAANVNIADNAPDGTTISEWKGAANGVTLINTQGNGNLNETIANLPNGAVITYEVTVQTPITFKDDLVNTAVVNSTTPDPVSGCPACTAPAVPVQIVPPVAVDDAVDTKANNDVTVPVLDNDNPGEGGGSPIVPTTVEVVDQPKHGTVKVNADGSVNYTPDPGYVGADSVTYRVQDEGGNWSNVATVHINVVSNDLDIPNVITPNGDGNNDRLVIKGLERYQQNEIVIFNRWNNMLYRSKNYQNDWDGRGLNAGTYFYTLKVLDENGQWQTRNGFITLMR